LQRGKNMKFKSVIPYLLFGSTVLGGMSQSAAQNDVIPDSIKNFSYAYLNPEHTLFELYDFRPTQEQIRQQNLDKKAESLKDAYVENMLNAQEKLGPLVGKHGYSSAVRSELPGAPVGQHCVYGQYTQLNRALQEKGDTLTIIPQEAKTACSQFKYQMRKKYNTPEYQGTIREGVMHASQAEYDAALATFLARNGIKENTPDSVRTIKAQKFAERNYCADSLNPGSILIVPRYHGARNAFNAIMYLGRGDVVDGKFIPNPNGRHMYTAHNRERIGDLFKTWDTRNVFAADTKKIAQTQYDQELTRIESMSTDALIEFLGQDKKIGPDTMSLRLVSHEELVQMARNKYFDLPITNINI
jgi:hypothetical protein